MPARGSDADLLLGKWCNPDVTSYGLARRQAHTLPALQITDGK